jgi:uncharacterized protein with HEPN domain
MEIDQLGRLRDIREACSLIESYMVGVSSKDFFEDTEKQDAVIRRIEIIGEATAHLSEGSWRLAGKIRKSGGKCRCSEFRGRRRDRV